MCLVRYDDMEGDGRRHACGQGEMFRPKPASKAPPVPLIPTEAPPSSSMARKLREKQKDNIARAKRAHENPEFMDDLNEAQDDFPDFGAQSRVEVGDSARKMSKRTEEDSPGGSPNPQK